jgi:sugar/nucleoside kinase (ribokinase family)
MPRTRVAGHLCVDLFPSLADAVPGPGSLAEVGPLDVRLGGCVSNTGLALAQLGAAVDVVAVIGDDLLGNVVESLLEKSAVGSRSIHRLGLATTSYSVVIQPPGRDRSFFHHVGANAAFDGSQVRVDDIELLHVGYPQLLPRLLVGGGRGLVELLERARTADVTTSVDFATVDTRQSGGNPWPEIVRHWAPLIDVLTPSVDDLRASFPYIGSGSDEADAVALADELVRAGVGVALVTAGRRGMCLRTSGPDRLCRGGAVLRPLADTWAGRQLWAPPGAVAAMRTTGAGDTATAGFLFALLAGLSAEQALHLAVEAAALHVNGVDPLPAWPVDGGERPFGRLPRAHVPIEDVAGWTKDPRGLLAGPNDHHHVASSFT